MLFRENTTYQEKGLHMKNNIKTIKKDDFIVLLFQLICMHNLNDGKSETRIFELELILY